MNSVKPKSQFDKRLDGFSGGGTSYLAGEGLSLDQNVFSLASANQGNLGGIRVSAYATVPEDSPPSDFNSGIYKIEPFDAFLGLRRATKNQMGGLYLGDGLAPTVEQNGETFTNTGHVEVRIGEGLEYLENSETPADERERRQNVLGGRAVAVTKATKEKFGMVKLGNRIGIDEDGSIYSAMFGKKGIEVSDKGEISVLIDDETIRIDGNGNLCAQVNADGVNIENAIVIQEDNAKAFIRYFSSVEYKDGNRIGYGGADNPIPVQTYPVYADGTLSNGSTASIPEDIHFRQTFVFPTPILYGTASEDTEIKGIELEVVASYPTRTDFYAVLVDSSGTKIRVGSLIQVFSTAVEFYIGLILRWTLIRPPGFVTPAGTVCPYGCAESSGLVSINSQSNTTTPYKTTLISVGSGQKLYLRFRDETEYKAAVGLTENIEETLLLAVVSEEQE